MGTIIYLFGILFVISVYSQSPIITSNQLITTSIADCNERKNEKVITVDFSLIEYDVMDPVDISHCMVPIVFKSSSGKTVLSASEQGSDVILIKVGENFTLDGIRLENGGVCILSTGGLRVNRSIFYNCNIAITGGNHTIIENSEFYWETDVSSQNPGRTTPISPHTTPLIPTWVITKTMSGCDETMDMAVLMSYNLSSDWIFRKNYVHDVPIGILINNMLNYEIHDNIFENIFYSAITDSLITDPGWICNMTIENNYFYNVGTNIVSNSYFPEMDRYCQFNYNRNIAYDDTTKNSSPQDCGPFALRSSLFYNIYHNLFYLSRNADITQFGDAREYSFINNIIVQQTWREDMVNLFIHPDNISLIGMIEWDPFLWRVNPSCLQVDCENCSNPLNLTLSPTDKIDYGPFQYPDYPIEPWPFNKTCLSCQIQPPNDTINLVVEGNITTSLTIPYVINITIIGDLNIDGILSVPLGSFINVEGCANLRNTTFKTNYINNSIYDILKASENCSDLNFKEIQINNLPKCTNAEPTTNQGVFSISFVDNCAVASESGNGFGRIFHFVIIAIVLVAVIITVGLYFSPLKEKIFPYRNKTRHERQFQDPDGNFDELAE